jgi:hypothetical protein
MDCTSCAPARPDRPHTFLAHEYIACDGCGGRHEARVVLRDGAVFHLLLCPKCGQRETRVHDDAEAYVREFVARARPEDPSSHVWKQTTSTCPKLPDPGARPTSSSADGRVYFAKDCRAVRPVGGAGVRGRRVLRARLRLRARRHRAGGVARHRRQRLPHRLRHLRRSRAAHLPADHRDHRSLQPRVPGLHRRQPVLDAPGARDLREDDRRPGRGARATCESVALSGGEPTSHPQLLELLEDRRPPRDPPRGGHHQRPAPRRATARSPRRSRTAACTSACSSTASRPTSTSASAARTSPRRRPRRSPRCASSICRPSSSSSPPAASTSTRSARRSSCWSRSRTSSRSTSSRWRTPARAAARSSTTRWIASPSPASSARWISSPAGG